MAAEKATSEEVLFYLDLITNFIDLESLLKGIETFIDEKLAYESNSSFGLVLFQKEENPVTIYDKKDKESIIKTIEESWNKRELEQSCFENGLFEILSYIFRKAREAKKSFRIIIISDTPSARSEEYHDALYDLISKVKNFYTYIDIIRVGSKSFYDDEHKIKILTSETRGGSFYCNDANQFLNVFGSLVKSKTEFNIIKSQTEGSQILNEDKVFYERLAVDLISLSSDDEEICSMCQQEVCPICETHSDTLRKCFNCGSKFHNCCAAEYSIVHNIGFTHIFRCPQCETLLKLDEELVKLIYDDLKAQGKLPIPQPAETRKIAEEPIFTELSALKPPPGSIKVQEKELTLVEIPKEIKPPPLVSLRSPPSRPKIQQGSQQNVPSPIPDNVSPPSPPKKVTQNPPDLNLSPIPPLESPSSPSSNVKKVKVGGYFGREVSITTNPSPTVSQAAVSPHLEVKQAENSNNISITALKPPKKKSAFKFCKICGASVKEVTVCPNCGGKID